MSVLTLLNAFAAVVLITFYLMFHMVLSRWLCVLYLFGIFVNSAFVFKDILWGR